MKKLTITLIAASIFISGCKSTGDQSSFLERQPRMYEEHSLQEVTQCDYEWDDNKSFAMNAMLSMGVQGNVYEARNVPPLAG